MKKWIIPTAIIALSAASCEDRQLQTFTANVPVYLSYEELRSSLEVTPGVELEKPGKIYFKYQYMYINEYRHDYPLDEIDEQEGVVTEFRVERVTREVHTPSYPWPIFLEYRMDMAFKMNYSGPAGGSGNTYGVAGSMARFLTYDEFLYTVDSDYKLKTIDISPA